MIFACSVDSAHGSIDRGGLRSGQIGKAEEATLIADTNFAQGFFSEGKHLALNGVSFVPRFFDPFGSKRDSASKVEHFNLPFGIHPLPFGLSFRHTRLGKSPSAERHRNPEDKTNIARTDKARPAAEGEIANGIGLSNGDGCISLCSRCLINCSDLRGWLHRSGNGGKIQKPAYRDDQPFSTAAPPLGQSDQCCVARMNGKFQVDLGLGNSGPRPRSSKDWIARRCDTAINLGCNTLSN